MDSLCSLFMNAKSYNYELTFGVIIIETRIRGKSLKYLASKN